MPAAAAHAQSRYIQRRYGLVQECPADERPLAKGRRADDGLLTHRATAKSTGAYYTPDDVAVSLIGWAIRDTADRMLDPACGDGRFIALHTNSVGIEQDAEAAWRSGARANNATVHNVDFFTWAASTQERFDCVAGNPPFIRYQRFNGSARRQALDLCAALGASFSGLTSSWAPFLVASASLLRPGGRMAFVVPAEIGHAPYATPLLEYLIAHFDTIHVMAIREKLFRELSEDCWLLFVDGFGGRANQVNFSAVDRFRPGELSLSPDCRISVSDLRERWKYRLRHLLLPPNIRTLYRQVAEWHDTCRLGDLASVGIGYVSGGNDFFHLRPSKVRRLGLPSCFLRPTVRSGRYLTSNRLTETIVEKWQNADEPVFLLYIPKNAAEFPRSIREYLDGATGQEVRRSYKCRNRQPWYCVPDVRVPDFFLNYLSGTAVNLVENQARITATNALHYVHLHHPMYRTKLLERWNGPFTQLSCEIEGHPLGGGVLKLEPREATAILLPSAAAMADIDEPIVTEAVAHMQRWRHYS